MNRNGFVPFRLIPLIAPIALVALAGCAINSKLTIESTPGDAQVYIRPLSGGAEKLLGKTPLTVSASDVRKLSAGNGPYFFELKKEEYAAGNVVVTELDGTDVRLALQLTPDTSLVNSTRINASVDLLFEGQRLARAGRLDEALQKVREVQKSSPELAASYELEGGIHYMKKDLKGAIDAYRQAARLNPSDPYSQKMVALLEGQLGSAKGGAQ
jgi:tetratricopeptide (TPR) repeat protein